VFLVWYAHSQPYKSSLLPQGPEQKAQGTPPPALSFKTMSIYGLSLGKAHLLYILSELLQEAMLHVAT
jgi:hypothetical protein